MFGVDRNGSAAQATVVWLSETQAENEREEHEKLHAIQTFECEVEGKSTARDLTRFVGVRRVHGGSLAPLFKLIAAVV